MTGIQKIAAQIIDEAKVKEKEINEKTDKIVSEIIKEAEKEAALEKEKILKEAWEEAENSEKLFSLSGEQKKRQSALKVKQEIIGEVIDEAYERLKNLDDDKYFKVIEEMLKENLLPGKGEIIFSEKDKKRMPKDFMSIVEKIARESNGEISLSAEVRKIDGGFILVYGGIEENCTFKAMLEEKREMLQDTVNEILFKG